MNEHNKLDEYEERTRRESIESADILARKGRVTHTAKVDILMNYPYDFSGWLRSLEEEFTDRIGEDALANMPDDTLLAEAQVDMVSYVHPATGEFDVRYEGRWVAKAAVLESMAAEEVEG